MSDDRDLDLVRPCERCPRPSTDPSSGRSLTASLPSRFRRPIAGGRGAPGRSTAGPSPACWPWPPP